jgi:hypothetical protein
MLGSLLLMPMFTRLLLAAPLLVVLSLAPTGELRAQAPLIANPGFEADTFTVVPGYAADNGGSIGGWTYSGAAGLSPTGEDASLANNGAIPEGARVAFLHSAPAPAVLSTTISGLVTGTRYTVRFRANCRDYQGGVPSASWSLNGGPFAGFYVALPVAGGNPYRIITGSFTASADTAALVVKNDSGGAESTLLLDDFTVAAETTSGWSMHPWTDDASLGLDPARTLWILDSVQMGAPIVGGGSYPIEPEVWGKLRQSGFGGTYDDYNEILDHVYATQNAEDVQWQSYYLAARYCGGFDPVAITLTDLTPGKRYRITFYASSPPWGGLQLFTFSDEFGSFAMDQNQFGPGKSMRIERDFIARGRTHAIRIEQHLNPGWSFHLNGIALAGYQPLMEVAPSTDPVFVSQVLDAPGTSHTVTIRNPGTEVLRISSIAMEGPHASQFHIATGTLPADLPPGGEMPCTITHLPPMASSVGRSAWWSLIPPERMSRSRPS